MAYTVNQLAKLSGTSVRTLHWYDEIGLLKPAYVGKNGYRYYEEKQMLALQQILFFKELGLGLDDIQSMLSQSDFDNVKALKSHRQVLEKDIDRMKGLIQTIDNTLLHLRGEKIMPDKDLYFGFDSARQAEYEKYLVKYHGTQAEDLLFASKKATAKWDKDEWDAVKNEGDAIHQDLAKAINNGLKPESDEVQAIIGRQFALYNRFYEPTKEVFIGLTVMYQEHPDFKKYFDVYHPKMIEFISLAMRFYAEKNLD